MKMVCRIGLAIWERVRRSTMLLPKAFRRRFFSNGRTSRPLRATPNPAVQLLEDRLSVLVALLVVTHHPQIVGGKATDAPGDLLHGKFVVALDGELGVLKALLGVGEGDVPKLRVGAHYLLGHLLEGLLLLLGLLLEGLLLLLGLLHPLLGSLLEGLLLLLGLSR